MSRFLVLERVEDLDAGGIGGAIGAHRGQDLLARRLVFQCHDCGGGLAVLTANCLVGLAVRADCRAESAVLVSRLSAGRCLRSSPCSYGTNNQGARCDECTDLNSLGHPNNLSGAAQSVKGKSASYAVSPQLHARR